MNSRRKKKTRYEPPAGHTTENLAFPLHPPGGEGGDRPHQKGYPADSKYESFGQPWPHWKLFERGGISRVELQCNFAFIRPPGYYDHILSTQT